MSLTSKFVFVLGLLCAFLLILFSGRANIRHFEKIQSSIEEIYEDRLVVKGIIFDLSSLLHRKEIANITGDKTFYVRTNASINTQITNHLRAFRATKLTPSEEKTLNRFSADFKDLNASEKGLKLSSDGHQFTPSETKTLSTKINSLHEDLKILSDIQLSEGKLKMIISTTRSERMNTFARVENYILLIIFVLVLVLIFFVPRPKP